MKVSIIGTGYVGLVSGICLADKGHDVICVDSEASKIEAINRGECTIYEPKLGKLLKDNIGNRLHATTNLHDAIFNSEISIVAVGTPFDGSEIDLKYIKQVSKEIGTILREKGDFHVIVIKSTVIPGTTDKVITPILESSSKSIAGVDFGIGMNPEFLREGNAVDDFMFPDRIVLGTNEEETLKILEKLYLPFTGVDIVKTNTKTAEMIKYTSNALLSTLISFSNEIGNLCSEEGDMDAIEVMKGVHLDKRISPIMGNSNRVMPGITTYLMPGCGFGGSCFPKDVKALIAHGEKAGQQMAILNAVISTNEKQPFQVLKKLKKHINILSGTRIAVLGLAFKPGTDDMRESPAIPIINELLLEKAYIKAFDPVAIKQAKKIFIKKGIKYCNSLSDTIKEVDAVLVLTNWSIFYEMPSILRKTGLNPLVVDGRRMFSKNDFKKYEAIGL